MQKLLENPYWQHFCGEVCFQYKLPFDPSDFVHFRKRIEEEGMKKIFMESIELFGGDVIRNEVKEVRIDTTVQEKTLLSRLTGGCAKRPLSIVYALPVMRGSHSKEPTGARSNS